MTGVTTIGIILVRLYKNYAKIITSLLLHVLEDKNKIITTLSNSIIAKWCDIGYSYFLY